MDTEAELPKEEKKKEVKSILNLPCHSGRSQSQKYSPT